jgi:hypothetical protein
MVGREGFEPSTIGLKARDFRYIYLFFYNIKSGRPLPEMQYRA